MYKGISNAKVCPKLPDFEKKKSSNLPDFYKRFQ
jgi:hypothetical protein